MAATKSTIRYFDVLVDGKNLVDEVFPILQTLRPKWTKEELCQEKYSEGYVNVMCCFYQKSDTKRQDGIVVRIYGIEVGTMLTRDKEFLNLQIGHAAGCFPAILATFNNGLAYQYEPGRTLKFKDLNNPDTIKQIVRKLYNLKNLDIASLHLVNRKGEPASYDVPPRTFDETVGFIKAIPAAPQDEAKKEKFKKYRQEVSDEYLNREYEYVRDVLEAVKLPMSFCHGDFHPRNMIINEETGKVTFIDYEMSGYHYAGADIAALLGSRETFIAVGIKIDEADDKSITPESRELYAREYVKAQREGRGSTNEDGLCDEVEMTSLELRMIHTAVKFGMSTMALAFVDKSFAQHIDALDFCAFLLDEYKRNRGDLHRQRDRYLELKNKLQSKTK